ncbi:Binding-protein-dependent transport system inner membrane component [Bifidobacterium pseudolongum subsp. globosum]|uniref:amino acid ABC transporter permease n=1 Tax=Bifidobacterium TaxID=1678 RepID=UPI00101FB571|nr:ABC transporter permease subunit [Bifidobacterium pseudolongum]RYQ18696.1 Binding-protein-dependent transport system inner membrane component [Bifidobacterium pseudolongum subsp. globosum]
MTGSTDNLWYDLTQIAAVVPLTLVRAFVILLLSSVLGAALGMLARRRIPVLGWLLNLYASLFRGVPTLVQLLFWYFLLPDTFAKATVALGLSFDAHDVSASAVLIFTYTLCYSAYMMQTAQAAFASLPANQEALAQSLGYSNPQTFWHVTLPQALLYALPNICNTFISIIKALSLGFTVAVIDIFAEAKVLAGLGGNYILVYTADAIVYWAVCGTLALAADRLVQRIGEKRGVLATARVTPAVRTVA